MCPPCKIILDDPGALAAAAWLLADSADNRRLYANARYLARIATASANAILRGIDTGYIGEDKIDEAHAWSELSCHRASALRVFAASLTGDLPDGEVEPPLAVTPKLLMQWAEEQRLFTTRLVGGEYSGAYEVLGTEGIRKKD